MSTRAAVLLLLHAQGPMDTGELRRAVAKLGTLAVSPATVTATVAGMVKLGDLVADRSGGERDGVYSIAPGVDVLALVAKLTKRKPIPARSSAAGDGLQTDADIVRQEMEARIVAHLATATDWQSADAIGAAVHELGASARVFLSHLVRECRIRRSVRPTAAGRVVVYFRLGADPVGAAAPVAEVARDVRPEAGATPSPHVPVAVGAAGVAEVEAEAAPALPEPNRRSGPVRFAEPCAVFEDPAPKVPAYAGSAALLDSMRDLCSWCESLVVQACDLEAPHSAIRGLHVAARELRAALGRVVTA